jgi:hypothetical protein
VPRGTERIKYKEDQVPYIGIYCGYNNCPDHKNPIGERNVDLPIVILGYVHNFDLRKV